MNESSIFPTKMTDSILLEGYHIIGTLSILLIVLSLSLVTTRVGSTTYKYGTASYLIACAIFDIQMCFLFCPHLVMQQRTVYTIGSSDISAKFQILILLFSLIQMYSFLYICIMYRHQSLLPIKSIFKMHSTLQWIITFLSFDLGNCTVVVSVSFVLHRLDKVPEWLKTRNFCVAPELTSGLLTIWATIEVAGSLLITAGLLIFTFWHMIHTLQETKKYLSPSTLLMQRTAVVALMSLCLTPLLTLLIPVGIHSLSFILPPMDANITCYLMWIFASNSLCSTLIMLLSTPDYRRFIFHSIQYKPSAILLPIRPVHRVSRSSPNL